MTLLMIILCVTVWHYMGYNLQTFRNESCR